jgi:mannose-6-phosphate isomerase-like protein (cupin superfamily)
MKPYVGPLENVTLENVNFRRVLFTGKREQLVVMALAPGEDIGREIHADVDQFFRVEEGIARFVFGPGEEHVVRAGDAVVVPAGTFHNVVNASSTKLLRLFTIYSPPQHPDGTVQHTKAEALASAHH